MSTNEIDTLLERYLTLLDQYTKLNAQLTSLQSSVNIPPFIMVLELS